LESKNNEPALPGVNKKLCFHKKQTNIGDFNRSFPWVFILLSEEIHPMRVQILIYSSINLFFGKNFVYHILIYSLPSPQKLPSELSFAQRLSSASPFQHGSNCTSASLSSMPQISRTRKASL